MGVIIVIVTLVLLAPAVLLLVLAGMRRGRAQRSRSKMVQEPAAEGGFVQNSSALSTAHDPQSLRARE